MKKTRILIIEDNRLLREGLISMLNEQDNFKVVGSSADAKNLEKIRSAKTEILLLDLGLRSQSSLKIVKVINKEIPEIKIIVMDLVPLQNDMLELIKAGVAGFILKDATVQDFLKTIHSVTRGNKVLPPHLTDSLFSQIVESALKKDSSSLIKSSLRLTKRERQVMELIADGLTNKEIGQNLHLSHHTIKSHVHNILDKLALHSRVQIAMYSHENYKAVADSISLLEE
jgi:DNA-binding NarL/FixJ family response regulator